MSDETSAAEGLVPGSPGPPDLLGLGIGGWLRNCWLMACGCWWANRRLTASCWLMRWAIAICCCTICGLSWGERRPLGPRRGWRAVGGATCDRSGGLWWSWPLWDEGGCGCPWDGGCDWGVWGSPEPLFTRELPVPKGPNWARPARWVGGRCPNTQKSTRVSLSTVKRWDE